MVTASNTTRIQPPTGEDGSHVYCPLARVVPAPLMPESGVSRPAGRSGLRHTQTRARRPGLAYGTGGMITLLVSRNIRTYVNGRLYRGDARTMPLTPHAQIALEYGPRWPWVPPRG